MIWFDYLGQGYIQKGAYKVRRTVKLGKSYLQGVNSVGAAGALIDRDYINFSREWATLTGDAIPQVDAPKAYVDPAGNTTNVNDYDAELKNAATPFSYNSLTSGRTNQGKSFDIGSYGIGLKEEFDSIVIPYLVPVAVLNFNWHESTRQETAVVTVELPNLTNVPAQLQTKGLFGANLGVLARDLQEYLKTFKISGYNQFGKVMPKGVQYSNVQALSSLKGSFFNVDGTAINNVGTVNAPLYVEPLYVNQGLPLFDKVYLQGVKTGDFSDSVNGNTTKEWGYSGYLVRFQGAFTSENLSIANTNLAIKKQGYNPGQYDVVTGDVTTKRGGRTNQVDPLEDSAYNVARLVRS
jgi:hypothetical protein